MSGFTKSLITELLKNREGMNTICSPVSAYLSLMMLADISEGEAREKLMSCLKAADEEQLRKDLRRASGHVALDVQGEQGLVEGQTQKEPAFAVRVVQVHIHLLMDALESVDHGVSVE